MISISVPQPEAVEVSSSCGGSSSDSGNEIGVCCPGTLPSAICIIRPSSRDKRTRTASLLALLLRPVADDSARGSRPSRSRSQGSLRATQLEHGCCWLHFSFLRLQREHDAGVRRRMRFACGGVPSVRLSVIDCISSKVTLQS